MVVLELVDARIRHGRFGVVYDGRSLVVLDIELLRLEAQRAPRQMAELVAEERVYWARIVRRHCGQRLAVELEGRAVQFDGGIAAHLDVRMVEKPLEERVVAGQRNALVVVVEVVHVVVGAHRHALYDRGVDLFRRLAPLLRGVAAEERVEHGLRVGLVRHEVGHLARLQLDAEELVYEREAERQVVDAPFVVREHLVLVAVELYEAVDEVPHLRDVRMEDVRAVGVYLDAGLFVDLAAHIAAHDRTLLQDQHPLAGLRETPRDCAAPDAGASYKCIILHCCSPL